MLELIHDRELERHIATARLERQINVVVRRALGEFFLGHRVAAREQFHRAAELVAKRDPAMVQRFEHSLGLAA